MPNAGEDVEKLDSDIAILKIVWQFLIKLKMNLLIPPSNCIQALVSEK